MRIIKSISTKLCAAVLCLTLVLPALSVSAAGSTTGGAADLRIAMGSLLSEHALLAMIAMQKGIDGAADFGDAAGALGKNTDELTAAIASVFGEAAGTAFNGLWTQHIGFFVDYVKATGAKDEAGRTAALDKLGNYKADFAKFLAGATMIPEGDLASGLQMHVDQLVAAFDSYIAKDYAATYTNMREAYLHMYHTGDALSGAIATLYPDKFPGNSMSDEVNLRSALDRLLSEHASLAAFAMQKGIDGAADFGDVAGALGKNTDDLTAAITSVFGKDAGTAFNGLWNQHIGFFVDYVKATGAKDEDGRQMALDKLGNYKNDFAKFLSGATKIPEGNLASSLQMHVDQLVAAFDSYVAKDYAAAYTNFRDASKHMNMTGDALASAIVANMNAAAAPITPNAMPKTGLGGTSDAEGSNPLLVWTVLSLLAAAGAAPILISRRKRMN